MSTDAMSEMLNDSRPLIVGLGGTTRANSSTERVIGMVLGAAEQAGARVLHLTGSQLLLPLYAPENPHRSTEALTLLDALRSADGLVLGSPSYHGGISGLVKNALDYTEDMARDARVYFDGLPVGCVGAGAGWQGANATLAALRAVVHALRGWPTPMGITVNSAEPLFDDQGDCLSPALESQARMMAEQVMRLANRQAFRSPRQLATAVE